MDASARRGPGAFQWDRGGWFGGQVGATLWLVLLGALLFAQGRAVGAEVLVLGLLPNVLGIALWRRRAEWAPYPAIQALVITSGVCALLAFVRIHAAGGLSSERGLGDGGFLLVYPALAIAFHLRERGARRAAA